MPRPGTGVQVMKCVLLQDLPPDPSCHLQRPGHQRAHRGNSCHAVFSMQRPADKTELSMTQKYEQKFDKLTQKKMDISDFFLIILKEDLHSHVCVLLSELNSNLKPCSRSFCDYFLPIL